MKGQERKDNWEKEEAERLIREEEERKGKAIQDGIDGENHRIWLIAEGKRKEERRIIKERIAKEKEIIRKEQRRLDKAASRIQRFYLEILRKRRELLILQRKAAIKIQKLWRGQNPQVKTIQILRKLNISRVKACAKVIKIQRIMRKVYKLDVYKEEEEFKAGGLVEPDPRTHINLVFIGHVDAGKSTTCGNILYLSGRVDERMIEKYKRE